MKVYYIFFAFLLASIFISCENEIPFNAKSSSSKLILNAMIDINSDDNYIFLAKTGISNIEPVYDATINIYVNDELKEQITEYLKRGEADPEYPDYYPYYDNFRYHKYRTSLRFNPGEKVKIEVFAENNKYHAWTEDIIPKPLDIEHLDTFSYLKNDVSHMRLKITFTDFPHEKNFYRLALLQRNNIYINNDLAAFSDMNLFMDTSEDAVLNDGKVFTESTIFPQTENRNAVFDDTYLDGAYTMTASFSYSPHYYPQPDDHVSIDFKICLISITEAQYYYLKALNIISSGNYDEYLSMPVIFPSNVEGGEGFVGFSAGTYKAFNVPDITYETMHYVP